MNLIMSNNKSGAEKDRRSFAQRESSHVLPAAQAEQKIDGYLAQ